VRSRDRWLLIMAAALLLAVVSEIGRPLVPPAPLRLVEGGFGLGLDPGRSGSAGRCAS